MGGNCNIFCWRTTAAAAENENLWSTINNNLYTPLSVPFSVIYFIFFNIILEHKFMLCIELHRILRPPQTHIYSTVLNKKHACL